MTVSLIISTYNWPRALYLCLDSVMQQTVMPSEILIADDGSGMSTRDVVKHFENISPVPVRHIWHEDNGFRLAAIRNKAIAASKGKYIIQIDGDLILQRNFIQDHMLFAREGCFVTGSRGIITELLTRKVLSGEITSLSPADERHPQQRTMSYESRSCRYSTIRSARPALPVGAIWHSGATT